MAQQSTEPTVAQLFDFVSSLPASEQSTFDLETSEGYSAALEAFHASMTGEEEGPAKVRKPREAVEYAVFLVLHDANGVRPDLVGTGFGSIGREASDPLKWSAAKQLKSKAEIRQLQARRAGKRAEVLVLDIETARPLLPAR